ncbi:MAG: hypothetical protein O3B87_04690 [bacterium]|nr:hypothetical protein [bacterium]
MSESLKRNGVILIIMIGIFVGMYRISTWSNQYSWCANRDEYICNMLTHTRLHLPTASGGTYENSDHINAVWSVHEDNYELTYLVNKKEVMHIIGADETLYIYDYSDKRWWKQPIKEVEQYNVKLPFEPASYTQYITDALLDEKTIYTPIQVTNCLVSDCMQYHGVNKNVGLDLTISISKKDNKLMGINSKKAGSSDTVTIRYDDLNTIEVPKTDIKIASSNQNILLDLIYKLQPTIETTPDYVEFIEQQRVQAEQSGEADGSPKYLSPTPAVPKQ